MYFYFQLNNFREYQDELSENLKEYQDELLRDFEKVITGGTINADKIIEGYFPSSDDFDIFISHSHKDKNKAIALANELFDEYGLVSFIDSEFWQYKNHLQKELNNKYSIIKNTSKITYDYSKCLIVGDHVNIILLHALKEMMDKCKCIIFLNTENSVSLEKGIHDPITYSPWIFSELSTLSTLRRHDRPSKRIEELNAAEIINKSYSQDSIPIEYNLFFLKDMPKISIEDISRGLENEDLLELCMYIESKYRMNFEHPINKN